MIAQGQITYSRINPTIQLGLQFYVCHSRIRIFFVTAWISTTIKSCYLLDNWMVVDDAIYPLRRRLRKSMTVHVVDPAEEDG